MLLSKKVSNSQTQANRIAVARCPFSFYVKVVPADADLLSRGTAGEIIDVSSAGFSAVFSSPITESQVLNLSITSFLTRSPIQAEARIQWGPIIEADTFRYGFEIISIGKEQVQTLEDIINKYKNLNAEFVECTEKMLAFVRKTKDRCDDFDVQVPSKEKRVAFIRDLKAHVCAELDQYFKKIWELTRPMDDDTRKIHQHYFQEMLGPLLLDLVHANHHVYYKPLGYSGDYAMMNFIYDYHGDKNYFGDSSYEKLFNNYTCNIPISLSNIARKKYLKEKILDSMAHVPSNSTVKILSIASGPSREITELLNENKITRPSKFQCLDFERKALDFVQTTLESIDSNKKEFFEIDFFCEDLIKVIRNKELKDRLRGQHMVYAFGIYDYLSDRIAHRFTKDLYDLLLPGGKLILCNISAEHESHRGYYELLGEWNMVHRTKEAMAEWTTQLGPTAQVVFEQPKDFANYWYLVITKNT